MPVVPHLDLDRCGTSGNGHARQLASAVFDDVADGLLNDSEHVNL